MGDPPCPDEQGQSSEAWGKENWLMPPWPQPAVWAPPEVRSHLPSGTTCSSGTHSAPGGRGSMLTRTHTDTHTHTQMHTEAHRPTLTDTLPGGPGSRKDPPTFGPWMLQFPRGLSAVPLPLPEVPRELSTAGCGDQATGHSCFSCTDSHCPPAIPRHILFNNLSLLNYLLAFTTSPPPPCPPLSPSASSHKIRKWKQQKKMRHQYICK